MGLLKRPELREHRGGKKLDRDVFEEPDIPYILIGQEKNEVAFFICI